MDPYESSGGESDDNNIEVDDSEEEDNDVVEIVTPRSNIVSHQASFALNNTNLLL